MIWVSVNECAWQLLALLYTHVLYIPHIYLCIFGEHKMFLKCTVMKIK